MNPLLPLIAAITVASAAAAPVAVDDAPATDRALPAPSAPSADAVPAATPSDRRTRHAETFDAVWTIVRDSHWDPERTGAAWDAVRDELRPNAEAAADQEALRAVLMEALARLGQSHFTIIPGELSSAAPGAAELREGRSGATLWFTPREGTPGTWDAIVCAVEPGSPAEAAGITPGMTVERIGDRVLGERLPAGDGLERGERAQVATALASGEPGSSATWRVVPREGEPRDVTVTYAADERPRAKFGALPPLPTELTWRHLDETERERWGAGNHEIGLIAFSVWLIPVAKPFDTAMDTLRESDGIIIDLRGNPGGIGAMAMGVAGHFTAEPRNLGEMRSRDATLNFATNPRRVGAAGQPVEPFAGPVAILVDESTASTSEIFAGGLQHLGRAKVFGRRTAGAALPAIMTPLPNGDVFLHAIADYRLPDGSALEATGVRPDNARPYDAADYAREGDPALAEAVRWIASSTAPSNDSPPTATP